MILGGRGGGHGRGGERGEELRRSETRSWGGRLGTTSTKHSGQGHGVERGEEVRKDPAAPLRTGYPARKSHLSPRASLPVAPAQSEIPTEAEERRRKR